MAKVKQIISFMLTATLLLSTVSVYAEDKQVKSTKSTVSSDGTVEVVITYIDGTTETINDIERIKEVAPDVFEDIENIQEQQQQIKQEQERQEQQRQQEQERQEQQKQQEQQQEAKNKFNYTVNSKFNDVKESDWFYEAVSKCEDVGLISGYGDGNFGPNDPVTFQQVCIICIRCLNAPNLGEIDNLGNKITIDRGIKPDAFHDDFTMPIWTAGEQDIIYKLAGGPTRFYTYKDCQVSAHREEALSAFYKTFTKEGYKFKEWVDYINSLEGTEAVYIENPQIPDYNEVSEVYKNDIIEAYKIGLATGYDSTGSFKPQNEITRAEFCQMVYNSGIVKLIHAQQNDLVNY